ncbi:hypothetical protein CCR85_00495 [Rhodothalassium salexigens]|uniref:efflux RND transporter periplasmic adaptor subunit n=1 Tax=Rhodothalassium salexigens TaxID=1086 RepID=UPI001911E6CC|nr:hypothetical protein [Rhodothalassium salexigens]MBK5921620.1 hypothetical protein [Rhodothalassium salexigens]
MKPIFQILGVVVILAVAIAAVITLSATKPEPKKKAPEAQVARLFTETVERTAAVLTVRTQGEVQPRTAIDLVPQVGGKIVAVSDQFVEGGHVAAGETLVRLDDSDYQLALMQAKSQLAQSERLLAEEEANAEIRRKQWDWDELRKSDRPEDLALRRPHLAERRADVAAAEANVANAQVNLQRTKITVPFTGRVTEKATDLGQFVSPGTRLGRVFSTETVQVRLPLTDAQLGKLGLTIGYVPEPGAEPDVRFSAEVGGKLRHWTGKLKRINAQVDAETRLVYALAELDDPYGANTDDGVPMAVGLFVNAELDGRRIDPAFRFPRAGLRNTDTVYVVNDDDRLEIRQVEVADSNEQRVLATAGVVPGERVVVSPVRNPIAGMAVEAMQRDAAGESDVATGAAQAMGSTSMPGGGF